MCAELIIKVYEEEMRECECQNEAHDEFDSTMMMCQQLDSESAIEKCEKEAQMMLTAALEDCNSQEPTCQQIAEDTYNEDKANCCQIDDEREKA
jgi:hypothetical protein